MDRRTRNEQSWRWTWGILSALVGVAFWAGIIYVAAHLIGKYW